MDTIFGFTKEQIKKQSGKKNLEVDPQYADKPIRSGETWEAALRGSGKLLEDPKLTELMHDVYRGRQVN